MRGGWGAKWAAYKGSAQEGIFKRVTSLRSLGALRKQDWEHRAGLAARGLEGRSFTWSSLSSTWKDLARPSPSRGHWAPVTDSELCTLAPEGHSACSLSLGADVNS